ncbi:MAG: Rieske 2Fe-2S domain-containing protein [Acidobacteriota bacterium]
MITRRSLVSWLWTALGLAAVVELIWIVASFLRPRRRPVAEGSDVVIAGPVERFEPGGVTPFPEGKFYLVRLDSGGFLAIYRECTHLGCTVPWDAAQRRFSCPCHASAFDITGAVLAPPAPRPLDLLPVRIENGVVKVDTAARIQRLSFDQTQAVSP